VPASVCARSEDDEQPVTAERASMTTHTDAPTLVRLIASPSFSPVAPIEATRFSYA
jgi:hypothetical protein